MFYKNILFVLPQYWFGFASVFSGQTLYEAIIYQGYNIVFTSLPIMWFAIYDEEFTKKAFLNEPKHYRIGLTNEYYTFKLLVLTVLKGIFNGLLIYLFVFESLNGLHISPSGANDSFWLSSTLIYAIVVINVNVYIAQRTSTHTWVSTFLLTGSVLVFFLTWWVENLFSFSTVLYGIFDHSMSDVRSWLVIFLAFWQNMATDMALQRWKEWRMIKREQK